MVVKARSRVGMAKLKIVKEFEGGEGKIYRTY